MGEQAEWIAAALRWLEQVSQIALGWLSSPAAWSQFALLALAYVLATLISARLSVAVTRLLDPPTDATGSVARARRFILLFLPLMLPLVAYALTAMGEGVTRSMFGSGEVIAFGKRVFLFLAARALVGQIITDPFLKLLGKYVLIPVAALYAVGLLDELTLWLAGNRIELGSIQFSALALARGLIAGSLLFWLGSWSNRQSATYIKSQRDLRPATRELAVKAAEIVIYGAAFLLLMSIMGIDLTVIAVLGGALGVGIGLGLQQIAANFISGIILLIERSIHIGNFIELEDGRMGTLKELNMRSATLETFDGKEIMVPNEKFITGVFVNWTRDDPRQRYEVKFSVSYDTDIEKVPALIEAAVAAHPGVLAEPEAPDCELRGFGDSGIDFAVEFWISGVDDGRSRISSGVLFAIWRTLRDNGISIPYPQREIRIHGDGPRIELRRLPEKEGGKSG